MIVSIVKAGSGIMVIEELRSAASTAAALTAFVNDYTPALREIDYFAFDTGWATGRRPSAGKAHAYNHDTPAMTEVAISTDPTRAETATYIQSPDGSVWKRTIDNSGVESAWVKV